MASEFLTDATVNWSLGMDSYHVPDLIQENQYARGVNVSLRGGVLKPRPGQVQQELTFDDTVFTTKYGRIRSSKEVFEEGKFQAIIPVSSGTDRLAYIVICGIIFKVNLKTNNVTVVTTSIKVSQYKARINWSYAGDYIVIFDYPDRPVIIDKDGIAKRSDANYTYAGGSQPEVPVAVMGAYNQNRLFIANDGIEFTAGDPSGSLLTPRAPVTFTEVFTASSPFVNQFFSLPSNTSYDYITAMGFVQQLDSSTGVGSLFISTRDNVFFYNTGQPRAGWTEGQFGGLLLADVGMAGPRSFANVNSDVIFLASDGTVRAYSTARNDAKKWGNSPISMEVVGYLKFNDPELTKLAVVQYFDNRVFITTNTHRCTALTRDGERITDYAHGGVVVMELDNTSSLLSSESTPVWTGLWTGIRPMDFCRIGKEFWTIAKENGRKNVLFKTSDTTMDVINGKNRKIKAILYTREYTFKDPFRNKEEHLISLDAENLKGEIEFTIERKPSHSNEFKIWKIWKYTASQIKGLRNTVGHSFRDLLFGANSDTDCALNGEMYSVFRKLQLRLTLIGDYWELPGIRVVGRVKPLSEKQDAFVCDNIKGELLYKQDEPDWTI